MLPSIWVARPQMRAIRGKKVTDPSVTESATAQSSHPVSYALERMRRDAVDVIPVVNRAGIHEAFGIIGLREILEAYGVPITASPPRSVDA